MTADLIRARIADSGGQRFVDSLLSLKDLTWMPVSGGSFPTALVVGIHSNRPILAIQVPNGVNRRKLLYAKTDETGKPDGNYLPHGDVIKLSLHAPFKYIEAWSSTGQQKFSTFVKWCFIAKGLTDSLESDLEKYCSNLHTALKDIEQNERKTTTSNHDSEGDGSEAEDEEEESGGRRRNEYSLRSSHRTSASRNLTNGSDLEHQTNQLIVSTPRSAVRGEHDKTGLDTLISYLTAHGAARLLSNIDEVEDVQFVEQTDCDEAQSKKLYVGKQEKTDLDIYAYMIGRNYLDEIRFYVDVVEWKRPISLEEVARQFISHPFNKTYPQALSRPLDQNEKNRLILLVTWYFIAGNLATDCALKEAKSFPEKYHGMLEYIDKRMKRAALPAPASSPQPRGVQKALGRPTPVVDKNRMQSTTVDVAPSPSVLAGNMHTPPPSSSPEQATPSSLNTLSGDLATLSTSKEAELARGVKRSAMDAELDNLQQSYAHMKDLTNKINAVDQELDIVDLKRQDFMAQCDKELQELFDEIKSKKEDALKGFKSVEDDMLAKRNQLEIQQRDARKRTHRHSIAFAEQVQD